MMEELMFQRVADVERQPVDWLWDGHIPRGKLTVIAGDPGIGKSIAVADLAARVTTGRTWPDGSRGRQGNVLMLSAEDASDDTIRPRIAQLGGDPERVFTVSMVRGLMGRERHFDLSRDLPLLERRLIELDITLTT